MADTFNAYHKWLGIPLKDQPPHYYRLLGIELFEPDEDVISAAADQRMVFLRAFQAGKHAAAAESLLNEISAARVCLHSPERRAAYDRALRAKCSALPVPQPLAAGAAQQEVALATTRTRDMKAQPAVETQELPLSPAPLPGRSAALPQRKTGPLPTSEPVLASVVLPPASASSPTKAPRPDALGELIASLPARLGAALVFLNHLPGFVCRWLLRAADNALLQLVGVENRILHNFLRVIAPVVFLILLGIGGVFAVSWARTPAVVALRERTSPPPVPPKLTEPPSDESLPPILLPPDTPSQIVDSAPPDLSPNKFPLLPPTPVVEQRAGPRIKPEYTAGDLEQQIAIAQAALKLWEDGIASGGGLFPERLKVFDVAVRDVAHYATYTVDPEPRQLDSVIQLAQSAQRARLQRWTFGSRMLSDLHRPERQQSGALFTGTIISKRHGAKLFETIVQTDYEPSEPVVVLCDKDFAELYVVGTNVLVLGDIIDNPREAIVGYEGSTLAAIWGMHIQKSEPLADRDAKPVAIIKDSLPVEPLPVEPLPVEPLPVEPADSDPEPLSADDDLIALAKFATALQNAGQPLEVPTDHPLISRWTALGLVSQPKRSWGSEQATGPPDTEGFGDIETAWASASQDNQQEWLELRFAEQVTPAAVRVVETHCPGALVAVTTLREGVETDLWRGVDPTSSRARGGTSSVPIKEPFPINQLRIYLDSHAVAGWNEIDAVAIVDGRGRAHWAVAATASSNYGNKPNSPFAIDREKLLKWFTRSPALKRRLLQDPELNGQLVPR